MPQFKYLATDAQMNRVKGFIEAQNEMDALSKVLSQGLSVIDLQEVKAPLIDLGGEHKISRKDIITFTYQLEQLLSAGVPLMSVLESLRESFHDKKGMQTLISQIIDDMRNGRTLSEALSEHEKVFSPVYISLVKVGEQTGQLENIFHDLAEMLKWEDELASKAKKIMIYPSIVLTVVLAVVVILMIFVVPQLLSFIKEMGGEIGWATRSLIATSDFINNNIVLLALAPFVLYFFIVVLRKKVPEFRKWFDCQIFKIPLIGEIIYKLKLARLSNSLSVMYGSGLSFTESILLAKKVLNTECLEEKLDMAYTSIQQGVSIHESFKKSGIFPSLAIYMLQAGEESGRMDEALKNVSYFFDRDAKDLIEKIEPTIEPVLTIVLAMLVLWIMMAVLAPVYDTISKIQF